MNNFFLWTTLALLPFALVGVASIVIHLMWFIETHARANRPPMP